MPVAGASRAFRVAAATGVNEGTMETENTTLEDIFNGAEPQKEEPQAQAPEVQPEPAQEQPRDEHGRFAPKGETTEGEASPAPEAGASPAPQNEPPLEHPALIGERRRRQEAERRAQELEQRLAQFGQPQVPQQPQEAPDQWEDPQGHTQWLVKQAVAQAREEALMEVRRERVMLSAESAKAKYSDYLDKVAVFERLAAETPGLDQKMLRAENPAEFAYSYVKEQELIGQHGSVSALLAAERAKWEKEALDRLQAQLPAAQPAVPPQTISNERNAGQRTGPAWSGPTPMEDLLNP